MAETEESDAPHEGAKQSRISRGRQRRMQVGFWIAVWVTIAGVALGGYVLGFAAASVKAEPKPTVTEYYTFTETATLDPTQVAKPTQMSVTDQVAPSLWRGTATVATGNTDTLYGVRTGWPQTADGAVSAAMNYLTASYLQEWYFDSTGIELEERLYSSAWNAKHPPQSTERSETRADQRRALRLDDNGNVLGYDGEIDPSFRYYGGGEPRYGAYQVLEAKKSADGVPVSVRVVVAMPYWSGVGNVPDAALVSVNFYKTECVLTFGEGDAGPKDWRLGECEWERLDTVGRSSNIGYQGLRDLLGPGWAVPADSTEAPLAGVPYSS